MTLTYKDGIAWANAWVVVKGTPYKDVAMKMINEAIAEEAQTRLLPIGVYAPLNLKALAKATPAQRVEMATHPDRSVRRQPVRYDRCRAGAARRADRHTGYPHGGSRAVLAADLRHEQHPALRPRSRALDRGLGLIPPGL